MRGDGENGTVDLDAQGTGRAAWTHVAEGFEKALRIRGLCAEDRACLLRQLRCADALAQRAPLTLAPSVPISPEEVEYQTVSSEEWDARTEYDIGVLIARYLESHPPPAGAVFASEFQQWSDRLRGHGQRRLTEVGGRHLRAVTGGSL